MADATTKSGSTLAQAAETAVAAAIKSGAQQADALVESGNQFRVDVHQGNIENLKQSQSRGLGLRVFVDHKVALVYTSDLRPAALRDLAERAVTLAKKSTADPFAGLPDAPPTAAGDATSLQLFDPAVVELTAEQRIKMAKEMEKAALDSDKRILRCDGCSLSSGLGETALASSAGPTLQYRGTSIGAFVNPLAADGDRQQSGGYGEFQRSLARMRSPEAIGKEAGRRAIARIGARSVPAQQVPVIMHPDVAGNWLQNMFAAFSGEQAFKKTSFLTEKLGQKIASDLVTLVDDGVLPAGVSTAPFDGEGRPARKNVLIDQGLLKMFVYNAYWAKKAGAQSTGNATRSYQGAPGIGPKNLYLANGKSSLEEILKSVDRGFYMVDQGAFGFNPTSGSYSYQAAGFWIEGGAIAFPVDEITCASTTLDMLAGISMVGNDLEFNGGINSPTL
ncbi:MAG: TldD/PmbA family protein, partial [Candidatus Eisenbacteria bacterium]